MATIYKRQAVEKLETKLGQRGSKSGSHPVPILSEIPGGVPKDHGDLDYPPGVAEDYYELKVGPRVRSRGNWCPF